MKLAECTINYNFQSYKQLECPADFNLPSKHESIHNHVIKNRSKIPLCLKQRNSILQSRVCKITIMFYSYLLSCRKVNIITFIKGGFVARLYITQVLLVLAHGEIWSLSLLISSCTMELLLIL